VGQRLRIDIFSIYHPRMNRRIALLNVFILLCVASAVTGCKSGEKKFGPLTLRQGARPLESGMAEIDITPHQGYRMAGYFDERFSTGTHDPLKAKAMVFSQGKELVALVFCDLVGLPLKATTEARAKASAKTGIPISNISICSTHSHTGPLFSNVQRNFYHKTAVEKFGRDPHEQYDYSDFIVEKLVKVITEAKEKLQPADVAFGIGQQHDLPFNRRYHMKNGRVAFNPGLMNTNIVKPAGPVDHDVGIILIGNRDHEQFIGGLTVFAMHADTVGGTEFSADYPYFIEQTLRNHFGKSYISAFGAGTCGDLNQIDVSKQTAFKGFDAAQDLGGRIGKTVLQTITNLTSVSHPSLAVRSEKLSIPLQTVTPEKLIWAKERMDKMGDPNTDFMQKVEIVKMLDLAEKGPTWPMEVQVYRFDADTAVVCLPCEIFVDLGLSIKKQSPFKRTLVISISNDRPSYVPTLKAFKEGSYEINNARVAPGAGETLVESAVKLLNALAKK
jgi:neutral ceramidase